jgi:hypothetical protein
MGDKKKVLAFAREPGGADTIAPVIGQLRKRDRVEAILLAKEYAGARFAAAGLDYREVAWADESSLRQQVAEIVQVERPDALLTSASSRPQDDMTEKYFWKMGGDLQVPSLAVLDQWQNYILRFSGPGAGEKLGYMPTCVAVMDETVRREMIAEGFPDERILVTGHPRFAALRSYGERVNRATARGKLAALGIDPEAVVVTFVSEPARRFFAAEEGFDEASTLTALLASCKPLAQDRKVEVVLKYHPRNLPEDFSAVHGPEDGANLRLHHMQNQLEPWDLLLASDLVVGMISILLVDSVLLGVPTLSVQLGGENEGRCVPEKYGAISVVRQTALLPDEVAALLTREEYRRQYLKRQQKFTVVRDAIARIEDKVYEFAGAN